jgi:magnesium-protoporphyrin O-methyltransferase
VLHRVVCCYPDFQRLLTVAADHCRQRLAFSHPRRDPASRMMWAVDSAVSRSRGSAFRSYLHSPAAMVRTLEERGMRAVLAGSGWPWQVRGFLAT